MAVDPGPRDLTGTPVILGPLGDATPKPMSPGFYAELDAEFDGFKGCVLVSCHEFTEPWPGWERHPAGDEIVYLISGDIDFVLSTGEGEKVLRVDRPGDYVVVPRGTWHTARPHRATRMLFVTPGEGTEHAEAAF